VTRSETKKNVISPCTSPCMLGCGLVSAEMWIRYLKMQMESIRSNLLRFCFPSLLGNLRWVLNVNIRLVVHLAKNCNTGG
jgi:hypothetical protein